MICYLLKLDTEIGNERKKAGYYLGTTSNGEARMKLHVAGRGAKMLRYAVQHGRKLECVRVWLNAGRKEEIKLKSRKQHASFVHNYFPTDEERAEIDRLNRALTA